MKGVVLFYCVVLCCVGLNVIELLCMVMKLFYRAVSYRFVNQFVLYCIALCCVGLSCIVLCWSVWYCVALSHIGVYWVGVYYVVWYCVVLYCVVLRCIVLYCVLYWIGLSCVSL